MSEVVRAGIFKANEDLKKEIEQKNMQQVRGFKSWKMDKSDF